MKKIVLSTLLSSLLFLGTSYAKEFTPRDAKVTEVNNLAVLNATKDASSNRQKLVLEAIESIEFTQNALKALYKGDEKAAQKHIESALGKLEVILASKKVPKLLPIDSSVHVSEYLGTSEDIDLTLNHVLVAINKGKVQEARALMIPLVSEIEVTTHSLPLASYPEALKLAGKYLHEKQAAKAADVLEIALGSFTSVSKIIPIPLVEATDLIVASESLAKKDKKQALAYLDAASENLKIAHKLGYISKSTTTYKMLEEEIQAVKKEIEGPNKAEKLFMHLNESLKEFKEKIFSSKS